MDNETIFEWNTDLFEDFLNRFCKSGAKRISSIGAWLQMKELKYLIDNSSWNYPYAAFSRDETYKKLLPDFWNEDVFKGQREAFAEFYTMVNSVLLDDFLAIYPTLVKQPNELADLRSALEKDGAPYTTDMQWGYCILEAIHTYEDYRRRSCEDINMERVFQGYLDNRGIVISDDIASKILVFTTMYPFSSRKRKEKLNAMEAYKLLNEGHCTPMKMLEIYMDFRKYIHKDVRYDNPARYIKAAKNIEYFKIDVGDEDAVNKACEALKKLENPSDFVGVVMEHINGENSRIETGFAQIRFLETLRPGDSILIINPSTYFVQRWPESLQSSTTFCVMNELERILLQTEFSQAKFCLADEVEISSYTKTLYFPRPTENAEQKELIHQICQKDFESSTKKVGLMMLISPKDELLSTIKQHYPGIFIDELPRRTVGVVPKRRILVTAIAGESSLRRHNQLMLYSPQTGLLRYNGNIPKGNETLYLIFAPKKGTANQSEKAERQARYLEFSRDIRIWYKQNNTYNGKIRVEANLYALPTMIQARRNKNQRGEKLPGTYGTKVCLDEEKKVEWLINRYPYSTKIQSVLAGVFRNKKQDICLKTAWYLSLDLDRYSKGLTQEKGSGDLMPYFGDMQINETDPAKFREAMSKLRQDYGLTQEQEKNYWNILDNLFTSLRKNGYCKENPVSIINAEFRPRHTKESQLRDALTKKSFSKKEAQALYQNIASQIQPGDNMYLGMALRLLTGLKVEILCALKWDDLKRIPGKENGYQLWIMRKATPNGEECVELDTNEEYRRYPLMDLMAMYLLNRREYILNNLSITEGDLNHKYILSSNAELTGEACPIPQPNQWKRLGKTMIDQLQIKNVVLDLPTEDGGKVTSLTSYHGDIFNTNFRYSLKYFCYISRAEERYLMGLQQTDTYSKHYLDFTNNALQLKIITKLNRMNAILSGSDPAPKSRPEHNPKKKSVIASSKNGYCSQIDLTICAEEDADLIVVAESKHGEHIAFHISEVPDAKGKNY